MIVILEGPDGGGKSTLVEKLADELYLSRFSKVHVTHHGPTRQISRKRCMMCLLTS
jgi:thymidylate kinase